MTTRRPASFASALLLSSFVATGCGEGPTNLEPADGGATGIDAGAQHMDAGPVDAGPLECDGVPPQCTSRSIDDCAEVMGCAVSNCGGVAVECSAFVSMGACGAAAGCAWTDGVCTGTAVACEQIEDESGCRAQQGCAYTEEARCRGAAVRCERLDLATCSAQPGCRSRLDAGPPPRDASVRDGGPSRWDGGGVCTPPEPLPSGGCNPATGIECDGDWRGINARTGAEYCVPGCTAEQCCSPRSGRFECVDRDAEGQCPASDLFIDAARIEGEYTIETREFAADSCALVEGCVAGPGMRRLLRFDTWTPNIGTADMFLGVPSESSSHYEYSACHGHYHFNSYAEYELLTPDGACVAATGHKQAFCLLDFYQYPGTDGRGAVYSCSYQGIQRDWQDVYGAGLDCQWVDVTDVPPGDYLLRIRVNTENVLYETNYENNEIVVPVTITGEPAPPGTMIDEPCTGAADGLARDCGWTRSYDGTCTAGTEVTVGCSAACGVGACTGDTVMRVCETALGNNCRHLLALATNDASGCGAGGACTGGDCCSQATFTCPGTGTYTVWSAPFDSTDTATCEVAVAP